MHDYIIRGYDNSTESEGDTNPSAWRLERLTLENFALSVVSSDSNSARSLIGELHSMIVPGKASLGRSGVLDLLQEKIREHNMACSTQQSAHQLVLNLFGTMQLAQLQGFQMVQFSYMLLRMYGRGRFKLDSHK